ncbi:MAG: Uma2 family endonuclease [Acidobacteria bacterium]|nr:Uma2 family endonuclease [Acidobacteriota bacterium]MBI3424421.1 Uma2 family endonuclease [Acidobacteriota bacterium]
MSPQVQPALTFDEYLELDREAEFRSEFANGRMEGMAGGSKEHALIAFNLSGEFALQLKNRPCLAFGSDLRLAVLTKKHGRYPDLSIVCGQPEFYQQDTLTNPTVLIEILSPSTEAKDRGEKAEEYRGIASLQEYLLIAQDRYHVEHYARQPDQRWLLTEFKELHETVQLTSINCQLKLADIYDKWELLHDAT